MTAAPLNLCAETLDGIRNHSWSRPSPATPEGQVVGLADRIAYCAHDLEDAVQRRHGRGQRRAGRGGGALRPGPLQPVAGLDHRHVVATAAATGLVGLSPAMGEALAALRRFNYERIYLRPESVAQADAVIAMLRALVEHYIQQPDALARPSPVQPRPGTRRGGLRRRHDRPVCLRPGHGPVALARGSDCRRGLDLV